MLDWIYTAIAYVLEQWHALISMFLDPTGGAAWALATVMLVVTVRLLLFPLFARQALSAQRQSGVDPLAGCLPILAQIPVFIGLFHVLRRISPGVVGLYGWTTDLTRQAASALLFGAPISSSFTMGGAKEQAVLDLTGGSYTAIRVVAVLLIVLMCTTTFVTQKLVQRRSGPLQGQAATVQKLLLYGSPIGLVASGFFFPILVLLYWSTNNLWTLGQQLYLLRKLPPPRPGAAIATT